MKFSDQIRRAILAAPMTRYQICKTIDFSEATLSRFMHGRAGLSMDVLERIADLLDWRIVVEKPKAKKKGKGAK